MSATFTLPGQLAATDDTSSRPVRAMLLEVTYLLHASRVISRPCRARPQRTLKSR